MGSECVEMALLVFLKPRKATCRQDGRCRAHERFNYQGFSVIRKVWGCRFCTVTASKAIVSLIV